MRSGIERILTDRRTLGGKSFYKIYEIFQVDPKSALPRFRLKFLDFPIFLDLNRPIGPLKSPNI